MAARVLVSVVSRRLLLGSLLAAAAACGASTNVQARHKKSPTEPLTIVDSAGKPHNFKVEFVDDDASRERGLMYRTALAPDAGMLFDFIQPQEVSFWMKNTYIPLDIIFIDQDGHILNIAKQAKTLSLDEIPSAGPARGVLELNGGRCDQLGIEPGDVVKHRIFGNA